MVSSTEIHMLRKCFSLREQIERFLRKDGNGVNLWVEDTAGEEVAYHKTVWFVKLNTRGDKWLGHWFFKKIKRCYGLKTYLEAFMNKGPVFLKNIVVWCVWVPRQV